MVGIKRSTSFLSMLLARLIYLLMLYVAIVASLYESHRHPMLLFLWLIGFFPGFIIPLLTTARWTYLSLFFLAMFFSGLSYVLGKRGHRSKINFRTPKAKKIPLDDVPSELGKCPSCKSVLTSFEDVAWICRMCGYIAASWPNKPVLVGFDSDHPSLVGVIPVVDSSLFSNGELRRWVVFKADQPGPLEVRLA